MSFSYGQDVPTNKFSEEFIKSCIIEVFQEQSDHLVFNSTSQKYRLLSDFLKYRVVVEYHPDHKGKQFDSTNDLAVFSKYNPLLVADQFYEESTFNPLKYMNAMNLNSNSKKIYRIASTDYLMIVSPFR
jgi:hypothetical protein